MFTLRLHESINVTATEHEKFLFNKKNNKRVDYFKIKEMFNALLEFGWNPVFEKDNIIALNKGGKNITPEPGNQIELSWVINLYLCLGLFGISSNFEIGSKPALTISISNFFVTCFNSNK